MCACMCISMYVCIHVCLCVCVCVYVYICTSMRVYVCMYVCTYVCIHASYVYVCSHLFICIWPWCAGGSHRRHLFGAKSAQSTGEGEEEGVSVGMKMRLASGTLHSNGLYSRDNRSNYDRPPHYYHHLALTPRPCHSHLPYH